MTARGCRRDLCHRLMWTSGPCGTVQDAAAASIGADEMPRDDLAVRELPADLEHLILGSGEFLNELLRRGPLGFGGIENVATGVAVSLRNRGNDKNGKKDRQQKTLPVGYMGQGFELRYFTERNIHRGKLSVQTEQGRLIRVY